MNTISNNYLLQQTELHKNPNYGVASLEFAPLVAALVRELKPHSLSDYGAGKKNLLRGLKTHGIEVENYYPYDPVFPAYGPARSADLVCCIDVLEHIEPDFLDSVLTELANITIAFGFFSIHMGPAGKVLSDGRNAHLIQKPTSWWLPKLCQHFEILQLQTHQIMGNGFWVFVQSRSPIVNPIDPI
jgi:hypothetical protein